MTPIKSNTYRFSIYSNELKRVISVFLLFNIFCLCYGQSNYTKELKTESDGYQWYSTSSTKRYFQEGAMDISGFTIIPCEYYSVDYDTNAKAFRVSKENHYGYINKNGNIIVPIKYKYATYRNGKFLVKNSNDKWQRYTPEPTSAPHYNNYQNYSYPNNYDYNTRSYDRNDHNSYGSEKVNCGGCNGTGKCSICKGKGYYYNSFYGGYLNCSSCNELGVCRLCHGTGKM